MLSGKHEILSTMLHSSIYLCFLKLQILSTALPGNYDSFPQSNYTCLIKVQQ